MSYTEKIGDSFDLGGLGDWGDGEMGEWVVGSEPVGRSLLERSLVIGHWGEP
jgi:hypothetical protein